MLKRAILGNLQKENLKFLVLGNSSVDLDSGVSSICYAYLYNVYHDTNTCFPYLDINSQGLRLRKDVTHILQRFGIDKGLIFFKEDLASGQDKLLDARLIFVDHNSHQNQNLLSNEVIAVIDHHDDESLFPNVDPRIISTCGSCASLVFNYWYSLISLSNKKDQLKEIFSPIADLILAPILMDTSNMTQKVEKPDVDAIQSLTKFTTVNLTSFFQEIHQEKLNIEGLTVYELLQKDYKSLDSLAVGFSSLAKPFNFILSHNSENEGLLVKQVAQFAHDNKLGILIMMTSYEEPEFQREIAFYINDQAAGEKLIPQLQRELNLKLKSQIGEIKIYQQLNIKASRKQVLPLVKSLVS